MSFPIAVTLVPFLLAFGFSYWRNGTLLIDNPMRLEGFFEGFIWGLIISVVMCVWYAVVQTTYFLW